MGKKKFYELSQNSKTKTGNWMCHLVNTKSKKGRYGPPFFDFVKGVKKVRSALQL